MENMMKKIVRHSNEINVMIQKRILMKRNIALFFIVIASSFVSVQPAFAEEPAGQETFDAVVGEAADLIEQLHIPGLSVGVIHGANSYAAGIGVMNFITKEARHR